MNTKFLAITLFTLALLTVNNAWADHVAVIVNSSNTQTLTKEDIKNIYSDRVITWANGNKIAVYNLPVVSRAREVFSHHILGVSAQEAASAESNRSITNTLRNPQKLKRERLVASIVSKNPDAIGYVKQETAQGKSGIKILFVIE